MFVITVIPLRRGVSIDTLSYFSSKEYSRGTILTIPIRNSTTLGLVTDSREVSTAKTALRAATFSLKKLPVQEETRVLGDAYIKTAEEVALLHAASVGSVLYNLLPPEIKDGDVPIPHTHYPTVSTTHQPRVLEAKKDERYLAYRSLVRETFAHSGSVLLITPTSAEADEAYEILKNGIEDRIVRLTSAQAKSDLKKNFSALEDFSKTKLIIATTAYACIERHDITEVIIEHARSPHYKELVRPYLDYRDVLRIHAKHTGRALLFADILPRTEEEDLRRREVYGTFGETPRRIELPGVLTPLLYPEGVQATPSFQLVLPEVDQALKDIKRKKERAFIYAARRGLSPLIVCMDCGSICRSKESGAPYTLIRTTKNGIEERWFVCPVSGERIRAKDTCEACGSWRLKERGIGIQHIYDELRKQYPSVPIVLFDHMSAKTYKKATFLRDTFFATKGVILLGTSMALPYLTKPVDLSVVVSMESLLATPTWRLEEENLELLLRLREVTKGPVLIQSRTRDVPVLEYARYGSVEHFYTEELELRKNFLYPPYTIFIHLTWQGSLAVSKKIEDDIRALLTEHNVAIYQNPTSPKETPIMYGLIRLERRAWPHTDLLKRLRALPPSVRVMINPDRIV